MQHQMNLLELKIIKEGVDLIVVDTAHAHTKKVAEIIKYIKKLRLTKSISREYCNTRSCKIPYKLGVELVGIGFIHLYNKIIARWSSSAMHFSCRRRFKE